MQLISNMYRDIFDASKNNSYLTVEKLCWTEENFYIVLQIWRTSYLSSQRNLLTNPFFQPRSPNVDPAVGSYLTDSSSRQGKILSFIKYPRSDDLVLRWLTSRGTPNVSAAPLARNPSGRSALSRTGIFKITTNYHYHVEPLQRCVLPRGLLPQIRHQVRWLPGGDRSQLSGRNQRQRLTEIRVWVLKKPLLRCGELKITFTTSTASSAFSAAGNWWAMQVTHWVVAKLTSWVLCFLAALAPLLCWVSCQTDVMSYLLSF